MAVFDRSQQSENGYPGTTGPLDISSIAIGVDGETERWVGILLNSTQAELLDRAVQAYVGVSDKWAENKNDPGVAQERRLAFIELLRTVAYGCEDLASIVTRSHIDHGPA